MRVPWWKLAGSLPHFVPVHDLNSIIPETASQRAHCLVLSTRREETGFSTAHYDISKKKDLN